MTHEVRFTPEANEDLRRLAAFVSGYGEEIALRAMHTLVSAANSLDKMPDRGRPAQPGYRELIVPFGSGAYLIRYRVSGIEVLVTRIFHSLEDRPLA